MYLIHQVVPGGFLVDLLATGIGGTAAYLGVYLVMGLTEAEKAGLKGLLAKVKAR
jgi:hypothetical protein